MSRYSSDRNNGLLKLTRQRESRFFYTKEQRRADSEKAKEYLKKKISEMKKKDQKNDQ